MITTNTREGETKMQGKKKKKKKGNKKKSKHQCKQVVIVAGEAVVYLACLSE